MNRKSWREGGTREKGIKGTEVLGGGDQHGSKGAFISAIVQGHRYRPNEIQDGAEERCREKSRDLRGARMRHS